ncbi:MAG: hypothetical protein HQ541_05600, partial [Mariniphaga sp.]|nr:hypothetical protein [Mariniphaga sp.]
MPEKLKLTINGMKTLIISIGLVLIVSTGFTQLIQENVIDEKVKILQLDNGIIKYIKYQEKTKVLNILNLDRSIYKTVDLPLPKGHFLNEVKLISTNIFNKDPLVEILYTSVVYDNSFNDENPFYQGDFMTSTLNLINEKGEVLLSEEEIDDYAIVESKGS